MASKKSTVTLREQMYSLAVIVTIISLAIVSFLVIRNETPAPAAPNSDSSQPTFYDDEADIVSDAPQVNN